MESSGYEAISEDEDWMKNDNSVQVESGKRNKSLFIHGTGAFTMYANSEVLSQDVKLRQSCILVLDSLENKSDIKKKDELCATLRDYLSCKYKETYPGKQRVFSASTIPATSPAVPQQPNSTDCGLFLIKNVECVLKKKILDFTFSDFIS